MGRPIGRRTAGCTPGATESFVLLGSVAAFAAPAPTSLDAGARITLLLGLYARGRGRYHSASSVRFPHDERTPSLDDAVIVPVYNEVEFVEPVLERLREVWYGEVIVVDDGSTDGSTEYLATRDDILVVPHATNLGYGKSLIDAIAFSRFVGIERVVTMDADGQHRPEDVPRFFEALSGVDFVSGSRYRPDSHVTSSAPEERQHINHLLTEKIDQATRYDITDAFCGMKAYCMDVFDKIHLTEPGYAVCVEFWAKADKAGLDMVELPVERIYVDLHRSFGPELDDPERRLAYYLDAWDRALASPEA
jgi:glycosyltransferase involved in cell wall biosynthesis